MRALLLLTLALSLRGHAQETASSTDEHRSIPVDYDSGMPLVPPSFPVSFKAEVEQRVVRSKGNTDWRVTRGEVEHDNNDGDDDADTNAGDGTSSSTSSASASASASASVAAAAAAPVPEDDDEQREPVLATVYYERKMQAERFEVHAPRAMTYIFLYSKAGGGWRLFAFTHARIHHSTRCSVVQVGCERYI